MNTTVLRCSRETSPRQQAGQITDPVANKVPMLYTGPTLRASAPGPQAWTPLPQGRYCVAFPPGRKFWNLIPSLMHTERQGRDLNRTTSLPLWALVLAAASSGPTGRGRFLSLLGSGWSHLSGFATGKMPASMCAICRPTHGRATWLVGLPLPGFVRPQRTPGGGATA